VSVITQFTVAGEEFPLGSLFDLRPEMTVRLESVVPTGEAVMPYVWVPSETASTVVERLRGNERTVSVESIHEIDDETLIRVDWSPDLDGLIAELIASWATVLRGEGRDGDWTLQVLFPDEKMLSEFYRRCAREGIRIDPDPIHESFESDGEDHGLTPEQLETLLLALDGGYYDVPRQMTLQDIGAELGISDTAASQRLRRGLATLLSDTLGTEADTGE
jgi:predicted DNA binding protein